MISLCIIQMILPNGSCIFFSNMTSQYCVLILKCLKINNELWVERLDD
jgi:hypothetical protein